MVFRVILAGLLGGALMFGGGFVEHMMLDWVGRQMKQPLEESALRNEFRKHFPDAGVYGFPHPPKDFKTMSKADQEKTWHELGEEYKKGPSAFVIVAPTGEEMMDWKTLTSEFGTNVLAALFAAIVVSMTRPSIGFCGRWFVCFLFGAFAWVSVNASYHIWYRFPWAWVQDELFCSLLEVGVAGIVIAAIVRPPAEVQSVR